MSTREKSLLVWSNAKESQVFDKKMQRSLYWLKFFTRISHYQRATLRRLKKVLAK